LALLSSTARYSRGFDSPGDRLNTINEMNTTGSLLASFDITTERTEEELELSMVRSSRPSRMKRASEGAYVNTESSNKRYKSSKEVLPSFPFFSVNKLVIFLFVFPIYKRINWTCLGMVVWLPLQESLSPEMGLSQPLPSLKINRDQVARMMGL